MKDGDAKKFIENDGSKRYRISTHPDFVMYSPRRIRLVANERGNLLEHTETEVRDLAKKLPKPIIRRSSSAKI